MSNTNCEHQNFFCHAQVNRLTSKEDPKHPAHFVLTLTVHCNDCLEDFNFLSIPTGVDIRFPRVSVDGLEARIPIGPKSRTFQENISPAEFEKRRNQNH